MSPIRSRLLTLTCAATAALAGVTALPATAETGDDATTARPIGLTRLLTGGTPTGRGIATFEAPPTVTEVAALQALGLTVQPLRRLPLALVAGSVSQLAGAVTSGVADDVYPDERLEYLDTASSNVVSSSATAARSLRSRGFTGRGVTVGVIDSGCDATHPDLADHVEHNVALLSPEYANQPADETNTLVVPVDRGPWSNTDLGSGHGTHVAGIIAADSTEAANRSQLGVAPDAKLDCFAIGAVITTTAVVTAFDYILRQPGQLGIDVLNNSWGNSFRQFDPRDPVNVATRAVTAKGISVVFAAGNSGYGNAEASVSPFNQAPWVISVAAGTLDRLRGDFSSNGLRFDNSEPVSIGAHGHTVTWGDRIGLVHPDLTGPGVDISSSCDSTGSVIGPCPEHGNATASGTSMASPHLAGAAAVLLQAQPDLTPAQVRGALFATASPVRSANDTPLPFWQVGYGHVNLDRAVTLVRSTDWRTKLTVALRKANARVLGADRWDLLRGDMWQYDAPPVTLGGSDGATYSLPVLRRTRQLHLTLVYPTPGTALNAALYTAKVYSPAGKALGTTQTDLAFAHGTATLTIPVSMPGTYTITVSGDYAVSDPDTVDSDSVNGRVVFLQAAQLKRS